MLPLSQRSSVHAIHTPYFILRNTPSPHRIQDIIDETAEEDIRIALLMVADGKGGRKEDSLAVFASTVNAAATCGTSGTAGRDGLLPCVDRCQCKPSLLAFRAPRSGTCYTLCSLAIAPCETGCVHGSAQSDQSVGFCSLYITSGIIVFQFSSGREIVDPSSYRTHFCFGCSAHPTQYIP